LNLFGHTRHVFAPTGTGAKRGRQTFALETILRIHLLQQCFGLSNPGMEEALHATPLYFEIVFIG
jgi:IS5 family transposase